jgi:hypothetical protein
MEMCVDVPRDLSLEKLHKPFDGDAGKMTLLNTALPQLHCRLDGKVTKRQTLTLHVSIHQKLYNKTRASSHVYAS